jgi:hypothetical protein
MFNQRLFRLLDSQGYLPDLCIARFQLNPDHLAATRETRAHVQPVCLRERQDNLRAGCGHSLVFFSVDLIGLRVAVVVVVNIVGYNHGLPRKIKIAQIDEHIYSCR